MYNRINIENATNKSCKKLKKILQNGSKIPVINSLLLGIKLCKLESRFGYNYRY